MKTTMKYFIIKDNQQQGPYSVYELKDMNLPSETLVWAEGMTDWTPAWKVQELRDCLYSNASPTPPPYNPQPAPPVQPAPAEPVQPQPTPMPAQVKKSVWPVYVAIIAVLLLLIMGFSCPSRSDHRSALKDKIELQRTTDFSTGDKLMDMMIKAFMRQFNSNTEGLNDAIDSTVSYHNYLIFSTTTFENDGEQERSSLGLFGHVFTSNEDDFMQALGKKEGISVEHSSFSTSSSSNSDGLNDEDNDSQSDEQLNDQSREQAKKLVNSAADLVKQEVKEQTDSTTTKGVDNVIDEIANFFKSLF